MSKSHPVLSCEALAKHFGVGKLKVKVFEQLDFKIYAGESIAIEGASGAGKSTLLHCLGGLDRITSGRVCVNGLDLFSLSENQRSSLRNRYLGFIYQFHHLLPEFNALENVMMPLLIRGDRVETASNEAGTLLHQVGLEKRKYHRLNELSGGERQRVAIARALVSKPQCILADEPTGNLDQKTAAHVAEMMLDLNRSFQIALVVVTHNPDLARLMQQQYCLSSGALHRIG